MHLQLCYTCTPICNGVTPVHPSAMVLHLYMHLQLCYTCTPICNGVTPVHPSAMMLHQYMHLQLCYTCTPICNGVTPVHASAMVLHLYMHLQWCNTIADVGLIQVGKILYEQSDMVLVANSTDSNQKPPLQTKNNSQGGFLKNRKHKNSYNVPRNKTTMLQSSKQIPQLLPF